MHPRRGREHRKAASLRGPEGAILDEIVQLITNIRYGALIRSGRFQLLGRRGSEVLQFDPVRLRLPRYRAGRQVDRHATRVARREQSLDLRTGGDVGVKRQGVFLLSWSLPPKPVLGGRSSRRPPHVCHAGPFVARMKVMAGGEDVRGQEATLGEARTVRAPTAVHKITTAMVMGRNRARTRRGLLLLLL